MRDSCIFVCKIGFKNIFKIAFSNEGTLRFLSFLEGHFFLFFSLVGRGLYFFCDRFIYICVALHNFSKCFHVHLALLFPSHNPSTRSCYLLPGLCHEVSLIPPSSEHLLASHFYSSIFLKLSFSLKCKKTLTVPFCFPDTSCFPFYLSSRISGIRYSAASTFPFPGSACCSFRPQCSSFLSVGFLLFIMQDLSCPQRHSVETVPSSLCRCPHCPGPTGVTGACPSLAPSANGKHHSSVTWCPPHGG